jgi:hypothetical protein
MTQPFYYKQAEQGQNIYDLAIQEYGDIAAVFMLLEDQADLDFVNTISTTVKLKLRKQCPNEFNFNNQNQDAFRLSRWRVNCHDDTN